MNLGIDFGTTITLLSRYNMGRAEPIIEDGTVGYLSDIYFDKFAINSPEILVDTEARKRGVGTNAKNLLRKIKLSLDKEYHFFFDKNGKPVKKTSFELVTALLRYVKEKSLGGISDEQIENVVATVPAGFGDKQTTVIKDAVKAVFGKVSAVVEEPVSAALTYFEQTKSVASSVLVFDLGGGTCDIALVKKTGSGDTKYQVVDQAMTVEKTTGRTIGAERWDELTTEKVLFALYKMHLRDSSVPNKKDITKDIAVKEYVRRQVVSAKHSFSSGVQSVPVQIQIDGYVYTYDLEKTVFENWTKSLLNEVVAHLCEVYNRNASSNRPEKIICVGGGSRMPQIKEAIAQTFANTGVGVELCDPEFAVVKGAAIYANSMKGVAAVPDKKIVTLEEIETSSIVERIAPLSYGVLCKDNESGRKIISNIIKKGTPLTAFGEKVFSTTKGSISNIHLEVYENNSNKAKTLYYASNHRKVGIIPFKFGNFSILRKNLTVNMVMDKTNTLYVQLKDKKNHSVSKLIKLSDIKE